MKKKCQGTVSHRAIFCQEGRTGRHRQTRRSV